MFSGQGRGMWVILKDVNSFSLQRPICPFGRNASFPSAIILTLCHFEKLIERKDKFGKASGQTHTHTRTHMHARILDEDRPSSLAYRFLMRIAGVTAATH